MNAILNTSLSFEWAAVLGDIPWALLPIANRPLLDYWLEACSDIGVEQVQIVLGDGAKRIEDYVGSGERWNLTVEYAFARSGESDLDYLQAAKAHWQQGVFYLGAPFFMRRRQAFKCSEYAQLDSCRHDNGEQLAFMFARSAEEVEQRLANQADGSRGLEQIHVQPFSIDSIRAYFDLNMKMVATEFPRYVTAGFSSSDGSLVGHNVRTPPSTHLQAPIIIGDNCRFGVMTSVGPRAIIDNHVIVDAHTELEDCLILSDTYIGRNLEIRNKIVSGNRVIDPTDGAVVEIQDSWLVARNRPEMRTEDVVRYAILWSAAACIALVQFIPFILLLGFLRTTKVAGFVGRKFHDPKTGYITLPVFGKLKSRKCVVYRLFRGLSLDRFPWLLLVLRGKLFLCGQPPMRHPEDDSIIKELPHYYPGVFCYQDYNRDSDRLVDSLWYAHIRSLYEDVKILIKALVSRFVTAGR